MQRLNPGGKISVTLRGAWYVSRWKPVQAAAAAGLTMVGKDPLPFTQTDYEGYEHETTESGASEADVSKGFTYVFTRS